MGRPRATFPTVRERKRGPIVTLRVWWGGKWNVVGQKGEDAAKVRDRILMLLQATPPPAPRPVVLPAARGLSVHGLFRAYLESPSAPVDERDRAVIKRAGMLLGDFCGDTFPAGSLDSDRLADWQEGLCAEPALRGGGSPRKPSAPLGRTLSSQYITRLLASVRRVYRWGATKKLVPKLVSGDLTNVERLRPGKARRNPEVTAANPDDVALVMPHLPPMVADILRIQIATGARPKELCSMLPREIVRSGKVPTGKKLIDLSKFGGLWLYRPGSHKTESRGKLRLIPIPVSVQPILEPYLRGDPGERCFTLNESRYGRALKLACEMAGVKLTAYSIRHLAITEVADQFGARAAQLFAGHSSLSTTSRYLDSDSELLFKVAASR